MIKPIAPDELPYADILSENIVIMVINELIKEFWDKDESCAIVNKNRIRTEVKKVQESFSSKAFVYVLTNILKFYEDVGWQVIDSGMQYEERIIFKRK